MPITSPILESIAHWCNLCSAIVYVLVSHSLRQTESSPFTVLGKMEYNRETKMRLPDVLHTQWNEIKHYLTFGTVSRIRQALIGHKTSYICFLSLNFCSVCSAS